VAIKTLPVLFARDPERNARFAREAQLLAALNHPHIGGIYGVEEDGTPPSSFSSSSTVFRSPIGWATACCRETRR
jgi:serine/threonine protein kinase